MRDCSVRNEFFVVQKRVCIEWSFFGQKSHMLAKRFYLKIVAYLPITFGENSLSSFFSVLENNPLTNAGFGSNLTLEGYVENDAAVMDGKTLLYGGCGAVRKVKNPIELACDICIKQRHDLPLGLIPPSLLVSNGAIHYARKIGLKIVNNKSLISPKALRQHRKYKKMLDFYANVKYEIMDTVGAVCVDSAGNVAAAASSG